MSRIGKKPIPLPSGVEVNLTDEQIKVKGPKGELSRVHIPMTAVEIEGQTVLVKKAKEHPKANAFRGLSRTLINNMVIGVSQGYETKLELVRVGYKADLQGRNLHLAVGYSNPD